MKILPQHLAPALLLPALIAAAPAAAQSIYVKPAENSNRPAVGDLGMKPRTPAKPPAAAQPSDTPPTPAQAAPGAPAAAPAPTYSYTPPSAPTETGGAISSQRVGDVDIIRIDSSRDPIPAGQGGSQLSLTINPGYLGADDKARISSSLGLSEAEIVGNCFFQYSVMVGTAATADIVPVRNGSSMRYRFSPPLDTVDVMPSVSCRKLRTPLTSVIEENGYFTAGLGSFSCMPAPNASGAVNATFTYLGDDKFQCAYK